MLRVGLGLDGHLFEEGKKLVLGGVEIPAPFGLKGHSDGDALLHALTDAILGALGEPDIGELFPDEDPRFKGTPSSLFLQEALKRAKAKGYRLVNADCVVVTDRPKLSPYKELIRENLARLLGVEKERVNLKAKRREGFCREEGLFCQCVVLLAADE
ncbi:MAG: 2-C-methyl-D-erythritol 2,4-cyclodiphosphate synthase [Aquificae bacterium]|nr:2-C-methyl-D-erythritol 2,4-cyclodiphosphate synthase [Aquificota bacterium]